MLPLLGGVAILCGLLLLGYLFVNADPARLARASSNGPVIAVAGAAVIALLVLTEGRVCMFLAPLFALLPALRRVRSMIGGLHGPSTTRDSTVETRFIRDEPRSRYRRDDRHGACRAASPACGSRSWAPPSLLALLRECRAEDEEAARLLEAYLDRVRSNWRDEMAGEQARGSPRPSGPDVTVDEAYAILGLAPGADAEAIKAAHHRLMKQLHPDHGGTDYLASKINRARDVLLHR